MYSMCRKSEVDCSFNKLVACFVCLFFSHGNQCAETRNSVHGEAFEVSMKIQILGVNLERHTQNLYILNAQFS